MREVRRRRTFCGDAQRAPRASLQVPRASLRRRSEKGDELRSLAARLRSAAATRSQRRVARECDPWPSASAASSRSSRALPIFAPADASAVIRRRTDDSPHPPSYRPVRRGSRPSPSPADSRCQIVTSLRVRGAGSTSCRRSRMAWAISLQMRLVRRWHAARSRRGLKPTRASARRTTSRWRSTARVRRPTSTTTFNRRTRERISWPSMFATSMNLGRTPRGLGGGISRDSRVRGRARPSPGARRTVSER